jgi:hypothetical protein
MQFSFNGDPFDAVIVATAVLKDLPLITSDQAIVASLGSSPIRLASGRSKLWTPHVGPAGPELPTKGK